MEDAAGDLNDGAESIDGFEKWRFVFLQIFIVSAREPLESNEESRERPQHAPRLPANQFETVRVLLLWHQAASGAVRVCEGHESEFGGAIYDEVFGPAREVRQCERRGEEEFRNVVAVAHGVETIFGRAVESETRC